MLSTNFWKVRNGWRNGNYLGRKKKGERRKPIACRQVGTELLHPEETLSGSVFISSENSKRKARVKPNVEKGICWTSAHSVVEPIRSPLPSCASMQLCFLCFGAESWRFILQSSWTWPAGPEKCRDEVRLK